MRRRRAARPLPLPRGRRTLLTGTLRALTAFAAALLGPACGGPDASIPASDATGEAHADSIVPPETTRAVALTFDDLPAVGTRSDVAAHDTITTGILAALAAYDAPAIGFVNESKLAPGGTADSARIALLRRWLEAGHALGNHTYGHPDLHEVPLAAFEADVLRGEQVTRRLLAERGTTPQWFRHPFLHTGRDLETKRALEAFLDEHGYRVAPVTIDNYDYVFARAFDRAVDRADFAAARRIGDAYITYMDTVFGFYEAQSRAILGEEPPQVLLLHANRINAERLDDLLAMMRRRGYAFTTIDAALEHPAYDRADTYTGPAGMTWLHRWALTAGMPGSTFAGEPPVPDWVTAAAEGG